MQAICLKGLWFYLNLIFKIFDRETRRERILDNRTKSIKIKEKQKIILEKSKEFERQRREEKLRREGCPVQRAEKKFFDSLRQTMKDREAKNAEVQQLL